MSGAASCEEYRIGFARPEAEAELRGIFLETDMDLAGELAEHVLITREDQVVGGGMMTQTGCGMFHLSVFAVRESERGRGIGNLLLGKLIARPWDYALNGWPSPAGDFMVTTVAKGRSAGFYLRSGFVPCDFSLLAEPFRGQCAECPEKEECHPVPMRFLASSPANGASIRPTVSEESRG